jgi:hypothetical protein
MAMTQDERVALKLQVLGGAEAAKAWNAALEALHVYARASDCPLGHDVAVWFRERQHAYQEAMSDAIRRAAVGSAQVEEG